MTRYVEKVSTRMSAAILVLDAITKRPVSDAGFQFLDVDDVWDLHVSSDQYYVFVGIPPGAQRMVIRAPKYEPLETTVDVPARPNISNSVFEFLLQPVIKATGR